jgi:hypothetical protein
MWRIEPMRTEPLSPAELAPIPEFIEKWTAIGHSTEPIDRDWAEGALAGFYEFAGLSEPWVVWAPCPFSAALSAAVYTAITTGWPKIEVRDADDLDHAFRRVTRFGLIVPRHHLASERMQVIVRRILGRALRLRAAKAGGDEELPPFPVRTAFAAASRAAHYGRIDPSLHDSLKTLVVGPIEAALESGIGGPLRRLLRQVISGLDQRLRTAAEAHLGAPLGLGFAAEMDFANQVLGLPLDRSFVDLAERGGLFWVFDGLCIAADRPSHINRDPEGRFHGEVGPSIAYRSGWSWWHWHGTEVEREIIEEPHRITLDAIDRMRSPELRQIMIERYRAADKTHGHSAYLRDAGGVRLDDDPAFGTLWRRTARGDEPLLMVEVVNHTPEPDGSHKHHFLRVDPQVRPILADGSFGPPQALTARNAIAASFGLTGEEYMPEVET